MKDFLYVEKYRPEKISECILPGRLKEILMKYVDAGDFQNLLFHGSAGMGKTTVAKALVNECDFEYLFINGSNEGRQIDTLRSKITDFASSMSIDGDKKCVIIDEFDNSTKDFQLALRSSIEQFADTCRFIFTCNNITKIEAPIISRCASIEFSYTKDERKTAIIDMFKRISEILKGESVTFDKKTIGEIIKKFFPDFRQTLQVIQSNITNGNIPNDVVSLISDNEVEEIIEAVKKKNMKNIRKWIVENNDKDYSILNKKIYEALYLLVTPESIGNMILVFDDFQKYAPIVADLELHYMAMFCELSSGVDFK